MTIINRRGLIGGAAALAAAAATGAAHAETGAEIERKVDMAKARLFAEVAGAGELWERAKGVLIMPEVLKAGLLVGGSYGEGALKINDRTAGYYSVAAASFGLQAGVQTTAHALFFMTTPALEKFRRADGWELGADAEFTVPDDGLNVNVNTTTAQKPVLAIVFSQDGFLAGVSLEGAKYSPIVR